MTNVVSKIKPPLFPCNPKGITTTEKGDTYEDSNLPRIRRESNGKIL